MKHSRNRTAGIVLLLLILLGCTPAAPASVAEIDPNAIQLYIQQTAAAAATQTQRAIPPTPTSTSTPRPTFTPEATFTPFQTFVFPTSAFRQTVQYFRVKHDTQLAIYDYKSRTIAPDWPLLEQTPEVVPLFTAPKEGTGTHRTPITGKWETFMNDLNDNNNKKINYLKGNRTALFNGTGFPQMESLTMGGNVITLDEILPGWGRVHTLNYGQPVSATEYTYFTHPELVHKFVVVGWSRKSKTTYWVNSPHGSIYWPFVVRNPVWIQMDRIEPFPILPMDVTANKDQDLHKEPSLQSDVLGSYQLNEGETAVIVQYQPAGSDVWARVQSGGWILLFTYEKGIPTYLTTWTMETLPPPP